MTVPVRRAASAALTCVALALPASALGQEPGRTLPPASDPSAQGAPAAVPVPGTPAPQAQPAPKPAPAAVDGAIRRATEDPGHSGRTSAAVVVPVILAAVLAVLLALVALARWWAWEPAWLVRWRHATAEAGWRTGSAWSEFTDWIRLGR